MRPCLLIAALWVASSPVRGQATEGFSLETLCYPGQNATATLSDGDIVAFDGLSVFRTSDVCDDDQLLASFPGFVFPSFLAVSPDESFVLVGESSNGDMYTVDLVSGGLAFVANLVFNFDAAFEDDDTVLVSAAPDGFGAGSGIFRLELGDGSLLMLAELSGASGPLAFDPAGDLVYGTALTDFPAPPGASDLLLFESAGLDGSALLSEADATLIAEGFDSVSGLAIDQATGNILLATSDFSTGVNRIWCVGRSPGTSMLIVDGAPFQSIANLEFVPGDGIARFERYQPDGRGGVLRYNTTDFFATFERNEIKSRRPQAGFSGPGAGGPGSIGEVRLDIAEAPPNGLALLLFGPSSLFLPNEYGLELSFAETPIFLGLAPGNLHRAPGLVPLDSSGAGNLTVFNDGSLTGLVVYALVVDGSGRIFGTSTPAFL